MRPIEGSCAELLIGAFSHACEPGGYTIKDTNVSSLILASPYVGCMADHPPEQTAARTGLPEPEIDSPADSRGPVTRAIRFLVDQAASELEVNLRATKSLELLWTVARVGIAITVLVAAFAAWGTEGPGEFIYIAGIGVLIGNVGLLLMLRRGKTRAVFLTGFAMDNIAIFTAWTGSVWLLRGALGSNDIYLALFPILTLWSARLGFVLGIPYIGAWLIWIGWTLNHYFHPLSYEVEQMPVRVVFIGTAALVAMWITYILRKEHVLSETRGQRARDLQELAQAKNEFISGVSHELRTPLTVIIGFAQVLQHGAKDTLSERQMTQLKAIERNGNHLNRLVGDLLDLTKLEAGKMALTRDEFEVDMLFSEVVEAFELILKDKRQTLVLDSQTAGVALDADRGRISQVLMNLVSNASKYSPPDTAITLESRLEEDSLTVTVRDRGRGMSVEDQSSLFTMFYRTEDAQKSTTPGTGIGLYLCKRILEFHGGAIRVESAPGEGTAMTFTLPGARRGEQPELRQAS